MNIDLIAGARPNFIKIAPIIQAIKVKISQGVAVNYRLIHTGQHYDKNMSDSFFKQLDIPEPDVNLGAGGGSQAEQTATIMTGYEKVLLKNKSDLCVVVGDVTSTMACAVVARKMGVKVAHVEGGIRSHDWSMPEEINRVVTDSITNYFFTTTALANKNLLKSGVAKDQIFFVGNTMIDTLSKFRSKFFKPSFWADLNLQEKRYLLVTIHRPANVDDKGQLKSLLNEIINNSKDYPIIFPVHPRTKKSLDEQNIKCDRLYFTEPMSYLEFNFLAENALAVITDSGGITEETTVMGVPCITLRDNTERPETVELGTNELIGTDPRSIEPALKKLFSGKWKKGEVPELWDGKTANRIIDAILKLNLNLN